MKEFPPFVDVQPPRGFVDELRSPLHAAPPSHFRLDKAPTDHEVGAIGVFIDKSFPDPEGLLDTVYEDFEAFAKVSGIAGDRYPIRLVFSPAVTVTPPLSAEIQCVSPS